MQNAVIACSFAFFLVSVWSVRLLMLDTYTILEFEAPPSSVGPPHVFYKMGHKINYAICYSDDYVISDHSAFISKFYVFSNSPDEVRLTSNIPPADISQVSARLYSAGGRLIANWPASSFKPVTLEQAKAIFQKTGNEAEAEFSLGSVLNNPAFSPGLSQLPILKLIMAWIFFFLIIFVLFQAIPFYRRYLLFICRKLNQPILNRSDISSRALWLWCLAAMTVISTAAWAAFGLRYVTVDDPFMSEIASGYELNHPEWHFLFINPLIGMLLKILYSVWPGIPFYSWLMICLNELSLTTVIYCLLRRSFDVQRLVGCIILVATAGLFLVSHIQFTMVSFSLALASSMLILGNIGETQISAVRLIGAIILFWAGVAIRFQPPLFVLVLTMPFATCLRCYFTLPGARRFLFAAVAGMVILTFTEKICYDMSPGWASAKAYDVIRGRLQSTEVMRIYDDNKNVFQAVGWSLNDFRAFNDFICANDHVFSKEKLEFLEQHLKQPSPSPKRLFWDAIICLLKSPISVLLYIIWLSIAWIFRLFPRYALIVLPSTWLAAVGYLNLYARLPERVFEPVIFVELSILLLVVSFNRSVYHLRTFLLTLLLFLSVHSLIIFCAVSNLYEASKASEERRQATVSALNYLSNIRYTPIIVNTIPGTSVEQTYLWQNFPEIQHLNLFPFAYFNTPVYEQRAARFGIHDVFEDLAQRQDIVFAVTRWDLFQVVCLETFIREHYGKKVTFEVAKIPGTNQDAVFPYFTLFKVVR